jgi:hypothetical protein
MAHDFNQRVYNNFGKYQYRKYENEQKDCRGLMDYIDDGVGWSKCSARDFSRSITKAGEDKPCLKTGKGEPGGNPKCTDKNARGYCSPKNKLACKDSRYPWFKDDCNKLCNHGPCSKGPTCTDKNEYGLCSPDYLWVCNDATYQEWMKQDCPKLCKAC